MRSGAAPARLPYATNGETPFQRLLGHNPEIMEHWVALEEAFYRSDLLGGKLKEEVRRSLAHGNGCEYCMAKGRPAGQYPDLKESLAVTLADLFVKDHLTIDDQVFAVLREEFTDQELSLLCAYISFVTASQRFGALLRLRPE